jgi:hypothetical protein
MYTIEVELAKLKGDVWEERFEDQSAAASELATRARKSTELLPLR